MLVTSDVCTPQPNYTEVKVKRIGMLCHSRDHATKATHLLRGKLFLKIISFTSERHRNNHSESEPSRSSSSSKPSKATS